MNHQKLLDKLQKHTEYLYPNNVCYPVDTY